jgi:hypothetical protein
LTLRRGFSIDDHHQLLVGAVQQEGRSEPCMIDLQLQSLEARVRQ